MDAAPSPLGISTQPAPASAPTPAPSSPSTNIELKHPWPVEAQRALAGLLLLAIVLLGWHAFSSSRWHTRPMTLHEGGEAFRVDLNRADRAQLMTLPGVGPSLAERIEVYRDEHAGFQSIDELRQVSGVGPATLERLRPVVYTARAADGKTPEKSARIPQQAGPKRASSKKGEQLAGPIDVNSATGDELQQIPGIGPKLSSRIIAAREQQPFQSIDDLRRVPGIGAKTLEKLRPFVKVDQRRVKAEGD